MKISITNGSAIKKEVGNGQTWPPQKAFFYIYVKNSSKSHGHRIQYSKTDAGYLYRYKCIKIPYSYFWNDSDIPQ